jgi:hypothetical protein
VALGELRKFARIHAITTAAENARSYGEEGSSHDDHNMTKEEFSLFLEECRRLAKQLDEKARKLQFGK